MRIIAPEIPSFLPPDMLLLGGHVGEDDGAVLEPHLLRGHQDVGLARLREPQQPHDAARHLKNEFKMNS